jgi:hypothetical protein
MSSSLITRLSLLLVISTICALLDVYGMSLRLHIILSPRIPRGLTEIFVLPSLLTTIRIIPAGIKTWDGYNLPFIPCIMILIRIPLLASSSLSPLILRCQLCGP